MLQVAEHLLRAQFGSRSGRTLSDAEQQFVRELFMEARSDIRSLDSHIALLQDSLANLQKIRGNSTARIERLRIGIDPHKNKLVRMMLAQEKSDIALLDANIARLRETTATTYKDLSTRALTNIQILKMWVAPHNCKNLPPEIMIQIFMWCTKPYGSPITLPPSYTHPIWNILQVCSGWRDIAMSEPLFWSRLRVVSMPGSKGKLHDLFHDICLNRGKQGIIECDAYITCPSDLQDYFGLVSKYPSRIRSQNVTFQDFTASSNTPHALPDYVESIVIVTSKSTSPVYLTGQGIKNVTMDPDSGVVRRTSLPWNQLTHLTIYAVSFSKLSAILHSSPQLVYCKFEISWPWHDARDSPIHLEDLHTMIVGGDDHSSALRIMGLLVVPKLKNLSFLWDWRDNWWRESSVWESTLELINRSMCSLESLEAPYSMSANNIVPLMRVMPHLTKLVTFTSDLVLESTLNIIEAEGLCPNLSDLKGWNVGSTLHPFIVFWKSRWEGPHGGLRNVHLTVQNPDAIFGMDYYTSLVAESEKDGRTRWIESVNQSPISQ